jgi:zinc transporter, ZIP family
MPAQLLHMLPYVMIASAVGVAGGIVAFFWVPGVRARSAVQHFAAGLVIAAVASDLIPEVEKIGTPLGILGGFAVGGLAMIALKWVVVKFERFEKKRHQLPIGLSAAAAVDTLMDGAIISAGFSAAQKQLGPLLAAALGMELFFLTLSVGSEFQKHKSKRWQGLIVTVLISLLLLLGAVAAFFLLKDVPETTLATFLAFGAAALIYLIAEELLVEAIEAEESLFSTAMLFTGFLVVLAMKLLNKG